MYRFLVEKREGGRGGRGEGGVDREGRVKE
jgi:hypothetical protein